MSLAYYNEFDKNAAAWLRELIKAGHIADGDVDERSIEDVLPSDLAGYTQCHFFAGIGVWSYALRKAGWGDDRSVWTGSCPCQPFSAAGKGAAFDDERHLWPAFHHLIKECKPVIVFGEQVASKDADAWIDLVQTDLEGLGYAFGAVPFPSAGVGAPHIRDRMYWVADAGVTLGDTCGSGLEGYTGHGGATGRKGSGRSVAASGLPCSMAHTECACDRGQEQAADHAGAKTNRSADRVSGCSGSPCGLADDTNIRLDGWRASETCDGRNAPRQQSERLCNVGGQDNPIGLGRGARRDDDTQHDGEQLDPTDAAHWPGPTNGHWRDADWLFCRDGKWRPVEPGTFPLVNGAAARVVRLRGYGNAINAVQAQAWIEAFMECRA